MPTNISQSSVVRGADGRLYAITGNSASEIFTRDNNFYNQNIKLGNISDIGVTDHETSRMTISPGL